MPVLQNIKKYICCGNSAQDSDDNKTSTIKLIELNLERSLASNAPDSNALETSASIMQNDPDLEQTPTPNGIGSNFDNISTPN
ncbi:17480_t:CDS:2, partial [Funneliformis caledonium]